MAICQHLSKMRQPLSTVDIIIISVNMTDKLQACLEKIPNVTLLKPEQTQAVEALVGGEGCARDTSNRIWKKFDLSSL